MIKEGERVILIDERGRKYLVKVERRQLHTDLGYVELGEAIGQEPGTRLKSHVGKEFILLKPRITDYLQKLRRVPQIMLPKDAAQIIAYTPPLQDRFESQMPPAGRSRAVVGP